MTTDTLNADGLLVSTPDAIFTYSGRFMRPLNPFPSDIYIEDIAHALSNQCRWTGHCSKFYSVAEHSIHVASCVSDELKLTALLHDASEAYLADLARPIKKAEGLGVVYLDVEAKLEAAISLRFGTLMEPLKYTEIKEADEWMLRREAQQLLHRLGEMMPAPPPATPSVECMIPSKAKREFLRAFHAYGGETSMLL